MKNIYVLIGPPLSGKETQGGILEKSLGGIPRFSMGHLIRDARGKDTMFEEAYQKYSMQGKHLPDSIKFPLLVSKMEEAKGDFILDNFPGSAEDVTYLEEYLKGKDMRIHSVLSINISEEEMRKRFELAKEKRGRADDTFEIVHERREIQDLDREAVLKHYRDLGVLSEINGEKTIEEVHSDILNAIQQNNEK